MEPSEPSSSEFTAIQRFLVIASLICCCVGGAFFAYYFFCEAWGAGEAKVVSLVSKLFGMVICSIAFLTCQHLINSDRW